MVQDAHIHLMPGPCDEPAAFRQKAALAGVDGGAIISLPPPMNMMDPECDHRPSARLARIMEYTAQTPGFRPVFWLDPTESDAPRQIRAAVDAGIAGFKVICCHFLPETQIDVFRLVAETGKPLLFHSGILWDERVSSAYNRPANFECLMRVPGLRFALAHVSWPWYDECLALAGKFRYLAGRGLARGLDMYVDLTPGTPKVYRREVLRRLFLIEYGLESRALWGSDCFLNDYAPDWARAYLELDRRIMADIGRDAEALGLPPPPEDLAARVTEANALRFFGELEDGP